MRGHYLTIFSRRLHRRGCDDGRSGRLFLCADCGRLTIICNHCDRGNIYCSPQCSQRARRTKQRTVNKACQARYHGRRKHAERARRYRERKRMPAHLQITRVGGPDQCDQPNINHAASACSPCDQVEKVTYQGTLSSRSDGLMSPNLMVTSRWAQDTRQPGPRLRCHKCGRRLSFLRVQSLGNRRPIGRRSRGPHRGHPP